MAVEGPRGSCSSWIFVGFHMFLKKRFMQVALLGCHLTFARLSLMHSTPRMTESPSSYMEDLRRIAILAEGSMTGFPPMLGTPFQSLLTSAVIVHSQALIDQRELPMAACFSLILSRLSHPNTFRPHSLPTKTYSTPLIQRTQTIIARCVTSLGQQDAPWWRPGV